LTTAIKDALKEANVSTDEIDMFNCHATSTPKGDASEAACIKELIQKNRALITANKGNVGHMVAGAAITESLFAM
jgi:3-oxoacyl-[acyl-carrier-protein] synthase II